MRRFILFAFTLFAGIVCFAENTTESNPSDSPLLPWTTDIEQTFQTAKTQSLPIYLYVSGTTWCLWW